jgi:RHS repeat-associated protein
VTSADGLTWTEYAYDGLNHRITDSFGPGPITSTRDLYYSLQWQVIEERVRTATGDIPTTADTRYVWSPVYVDAMIARDQNADSNSATGTGGLEQRIYALQDANWNTTAIVAASGVPGFATGSVIYRFVYTPFGESTVLTASWATPTSPLVTAWNHLFQGLKFNEATGLACVRNRDYSASLGRFIERDPIGFVARDNNWYRFVCNQPSRKTDSSGLCQAKDDFGRDCDEGDFVDINIVGKPTQIVIDPRDPGFPSRDWGHAAVQTPTQTRGLYPENGAGFNNPQGPGIVEDDSAEGLKILATYRACPKSAAIVDDEILQMEFQINATPEINPWGGKPDQTYSGFNNNGGRNCLGFVLDVLEKSGAKPTVKSTHSPLWVPSDLPK